MKNKLKGRQGKFKRGIFSDAEEISFDSMVWLKWRRIKLFSTDVGKVWRGADF